MFDLLIIGTRQSFQKILDGLSKDLEVLSYGVRDKAWKCLGPPLEKTPSPMMIPRCTDCWVIIVGFGRICDERWVLRR